MIIAGENISGRQCRECTLCCKLIPVKEIDKPANQRCTHQGLKGCSVYKGPEFPRSCGLWSCSWLIDEDTKNLPRPDRSHYVIDPSPEFIEARDGTRSVMKIPVVQIWVDPKHPNAHEDPALREFLYKRAFDYGQAALIRYSEKGAFVLFAPPLTPDDTWQIKTGNSVKEHSAAEILDVLGAFPQRGSCAERHRACS